MVDGTQFPTLDSPETSPPSDSEAPPPEQIGGLRILSALGELCHLFHSERDLVLE